MNKTMKAAAIHQFGGIDRFEIIDVAIPEIDDDEILIRPYTCTPIRSRPFFVFSSGGMRERMSCFTASSSLRLKKYGP